MNTSWYGIAFPVIFYHSHAFNTPIRDFPQHSLVLNLLNNQPDFLDFLWRHNFVQDKLDHIFLLENKMLSETHNRFITLISDQASPAQLQLSFRNILV